MNKAVGLALAVVMIALPAAAQKVHVDYDREAVGRDYTTFAWEETEPSLASSSPFMHSRIKNAVEHYLTEGGLIEDTDEPDLYVTYHTSAKEEVQFSTTSFGYGYGPGWYWDPHWGGSMGTTTTTATTYERGTLVIDIWDAELNQIVWRGSASAVVPENPQKADKLIDKALRKMVKQFQKMKAKDLK